MLLSIFPVGSRYFGWTNSRGEYVLSEDIDYNPNIGSNQNWQRIKRTED